LSKKSNIEILLSEWGAWKRGENRNALGYPDQSAFMVMRVDGLRRTDPYALLVDDDLRHVDRCIEKLYPGVKAVVVAHYVWTGSSKSKQSRLGLTRTTYYTHLDYAHNQLGYWMGDGYAVAEGSLTAIG